MRTPEEWITLYMDGQIPAGEEAAFNAWLQSDPANMDLLVQQLDLHDSLKSQLYKAPTATGRIRMVRKERLTRRRPAWNGLPSWTLAAAALLAVLGSLSFFWPKVRPPKPTPVTRGELPSKVEPEETPVPPPPEPTPIPEPPPKPNDPAPIVPPAPLPPPTTPTPAPVVPAPAPMKPERTVVSIADLKDVKGEILVDKAPVHSAQGLAVGQSVEAVGKDSAAVVVFPDGTRVDVQGETEIRDLSVEKGKRLFLARGAVEARVTKQASAMTFETPQATAKVLGTTLRLKVAEVTTLEVDEGKVRLTRTSDQKYVDVSAGYLATSSELKAKSIPKPSPTVTLISYDFEDALPPAVQTGKLVVGPKRSGNKGCVEGQEVPADRLTRVYFSDDRGLLTLRDGAVLSFDYWVAERVQAVDVYVWDNTRRASVGGPSLLTLTKEKWTRVSIPFSAFVQNGGLQDGVVLTQLTIQTGGTNGGGPLFVDNVDVTVVRKK